MEKKCKQLSKFVDFFQNGTSVMNNVGGVKILRMSKNTYKKIK